MVLRRGGTFLQVCCGIAAAVGRSGDGGDGGCLAGPKGWSLWGFTVALALLGGVFVVQIMIGGKLCLLACLGEGLESFFASVRCIGYDRCMRK